MTFVSLTGKTELVSQVLVTLVTLPGKTGLVAQDVGLVHMPTFRVPTFRV